MATLLEIGPDSLLALQAFLLNPAYSGLVVLVDENTAHHCYPVLKPVLPPHALIKIPSGERHKALETCMVIWEELTRVETDRYTVLLNLGGGVIGDMGGFCAAVYKRGIPFVQVPTTLLAQVDASVGGKLGIDFQGFKNHLGVFQEPSAVFIYPDFLQTLETEQLKSGFAEVIKHALIADAENFEKLRLSGLFIKDWTPVIEHSTQLKQKIVASDPLESGPRRMLNFGHTIGHAVESYFLTDRPQQILHGQAVAIGLIAESWISVQQGLLSENELEKIVIFLFTIFEKQQLTDQEIEAISALAIHDKKNEGGTIRCVLLESIGKAVIDRTVSIMEINNALHYYRGL